MKICSTCKVSKEETLFYQKINYHDSGKKRYADSMCVDCRLAYKVNRYRALKKQCIDYLGGICFDCKGTYSPSVYEFHHLDPSKKDFSIGRSGKSFEKRKDELDKCVLLCANCHRMRHWDAI